MTLFKTDFVKIFLIIYSNSIESGYTANQAELKIHLLPSTCWFHKGDGACTATATS